VTLADLAARLREQARHRGRVTLRLRTALSVEECLERLREACDEEELRLWGLAGYKGSKPAIARFDGPRFTLQQRFVWPRRPPLEASLLNGRLVPQDDGTGIEVGIRVPWGLRTAVLILFAAFVLVCLVKVPRSVLWPWGAAFLAVALAGHLTIDRLLVHRQRAFLTAFLRDTLEAHADVPDVAL